jgi:hypothetical protein
MSPLKFHVEAEIARAPAAVFGYLRDIDKKCRDPRSVVPVLEKVGTETTGVGSRFREIVRVLPFADAEVASEVTRFEPPRELDYQFSLRLLGLRLTGDLQYRLEMRNGGTRLVQEQTLRPHGLLRLLKPIIRRQFGARIEERMGCMKAELEAEA